MGSVQRIPLSFSKKPTCVFLLFTGLPGKGTLGKMQRRTTHLLGALGPKRAQVQEVVRFRLIQRL